ncbi:MAG: PEP-CTERM sorting domain-containing protein [Armatimonadota bacterium]
MISTALASVLLAGCPGSSFTEAPVVIAPDAPDGDDGAGSPRTDVPIYDDQTPPPGDPAPLPPDTPAPPPSSPVPPDPTETVVTPEPATWVLLAATAGAAALVRRRRSAQKTS